MTVAQLVRGIAPVDELAEAHRDAAMQWLAATDDIYRRVKPSTPSPHLVAYFLLVDRPAASILLCDHRLSGLWLPTGGHVEPGEDPAVTVRREAAEELGITVDGAGRPFFLTVTETVGPLPERHTDVSLWYELPGRVGQPLRPDEREFAEVRWWGAAELAGRDRSRFEPHLDRALIALGLDGR
ncbi:MAG TPA: NUDIX domain-containing protein [Mycobacteriales bacterium]|nr:NUDIX domain-containing protein [Mycobacteriales bacterium]